LEGDKRVQVRGGGGEGEAGTKTKRRARGVKQNEIKCFWEETFDNGELVFIAGGGGEEGGREGGREGASASEGLGEDGVGRVEDEGGEASRHAHCFA